MYRFSFVSLILWMGYFFAPHPACAQPTESADLQISSSVETPKSQEPKAQFVLLLIGESKDVEVPNLPDGASFKGDFKKVTEVSVSSLLKTIRFTPKREGVATLSIYDSRGKKFGEYRVDVRKSDLSKVVRELTALLADIEGISIKIVNNKVIVDGEILLPRDMNRIHSVIRQFGGQASTVVTLSPMAQKKIAEFIRRDINNPNIDVRAVNEKFILEGMVDDVREKQKAEVIAKLYVPDIIVEAAEADGLVKKQKVEPIINLIEVRAPPPNEPGKIVQLVVHYVELKRDYTKGFRIQWTPDIADGTKVSFQSDSRSPGGLVSTISGTISNLLPRLNWAKQHGHARVLQSSSIIVIDGQKGELRSVTRIPYQVVNAQGQPSTNFEEAGLITGVTPKILGSRTDSIELKLNFSIKSLLSFTDQGPLISNSSIDTVIVVRSSNSAAIGGLVSNSSGTNYNKLPQNASANPLISLYASKDFRRDQSQFVVFVTPIIKSSASQGADKIKQKFRLTD